MPYIIHMKLYICLKDPKSLVLRILSSMFKDHCSMRVGKRIKPLGSWWLEEIGHFGHWTEAA